jgi:hypothetical protein
MKMIIPVTKAVVNMTLNLKFRTAKSRCWLVMNRIKIKATI